MPQSTAASPLTARRSGPLTGRVRVPGDKSISHRVPDPGRARGRRDPDHGHARRRGRHQHRQGHAGARRHGRAHRRAAPGACWASASAALPSPRAALDFGNSGTGCRLVMGAVAGCPITATFDGDASLRTRPMRRILDPLEKMGARTLEMARGRPAAGDAAGRARPDADRIRGAGAVGAAQVGGAARGPRRARRDHRDREGGDPRPHREDAQAFRRAASA